MPVAELVYAQALFDAAKEKGRLAQVQEEFAAFAEAFESSADLRNLLLNPQIDLRAKRAGLDAVFGDADESFRNFLRLLAEKGRLGQLEDIHREFERLVDREQRVLQVGLTTAHELSDAEASEILDQIAQASGRKVEATRSVDPSLIGGIVVEAGPFRADASVRGRLDALRQELATR
jgi:F-type H+-transporting ATPase subunit delta